jgi:dTDP-4-dehydrorhamnose reductase
MNVLITGGSGLLGRYLIRTAPEWAELYATYNSHPTVCTDVGFWKMDLRSDIDVAEAFEFSKPDIVIHCAGNGSVDVCQRDFEQYHDVNINGSRRIIEESLNMACSKFVAVSTNAIFCGNDPPYYDDDDLCPVNMYGHSKAYLEHATELLYAKTPGKALVVRTILRYGWNWLHGRHNWASKAVQSFKDGKALRIVDDTVTQPTHAEDVAKTIWTLIERKRCGAYNISSGDSMSLHDFVVEVARTFGYSTGLVGRAKTSDFPGIAPRPTDTSYTLSRLKQEGIYLDNVQEGLRRMMDEER